MSICYIFFLLLTLEFAGCELFLVLMYAQLQKACARMDYVINDA